MNDRILLFAFAFFLFALLLALSGCLVSTSQVQKDPQETYNEWAKVANEYDDISKKLDAEEEGSERDKLQEEKTEKMEEYYRATKMLIDSLYDNALENSNRYLDSKVRDKDHPDTASRDRAIKSCTLVGVIASKVEDGMMRDFYISSLNQCYRMVAKVAEDPEVCDEVRRINQNQGVFSAWYSEWLSLVMNKINSDSIAATSSGLPTAIEDMFTSDDYFACRNEVEMRKKMREGASTGQTTCSTSWIILGVFSAALVLAKKQ